MHRPVSFSTETVGRSPLRVVYANERSCVNCTHHQECWPANILITPPPVRWRLRDTWNLENLAPYLKSIYGGICGLFNHNDPHINETMRRNLFGRAPIVVKEWED